MFQGEVIEAGWDMLELFTIGRSRGELPTISKLRVIRMAGLSVMNRILTTYAY